MIIYSTSSESETVEFGKILGECIRPFFSQGVIVFLNGGLGAGKTTLCRGVLRAFDYSGAVKSPTYTLVEPYKIDLGHINHFDFFRIAHPDELDYIGIEEYFSLDTLSLIEWPEKGLGLLPENDLTISVEFEKKKRVIQVTSNSELGEKIYSKVKQIA
ncbi:tRNA (adenosine(37)-N6)-threonylcarbamoyltransferase complex ATPase subunit type 1 TsaE [Gammaproteobacteria bacterium]|nr:tRNA (adenosine(37)-N6)-threonylcarbamoyltransferase complex ATPase subunit type 1 TsaE [Gammaproteobacteria bacterium]